MTHTTWVLTEERPAADGGVAVVLTAVAGQHPRVRHRLEPDGVIRAGLAAGSVEEALGSPDVGVTDLGEGERLELHMPAPRAVADMPTPDGLDAAERLQRGSDVVWDAVLRDVEVRGVHDVEVDADTSIVLPLLRHTMRRLAVTEDDRLIVLDEHAAQTRAAEGAAEGAAEPDGTAPATGLTPVVAALWGRPADVTASQIRVHPREAVRVAYVDGAWQVTAASADERLVLTLPIDFPAERFGDA